MPKYRLISGRDKSGTGTDSADQFPDLAHDPNEEQSHVTLLIHGYNNKSSDATSLYDPLHSAGIRTNQPQFAIPGLGSVAIRGACFATDGTIGSCARSPPACSTAASLKSFALRKKNAWHP